MPLKLSEIKKVMAGEGEASGDALSIVPFLSSIDQNNEGNASVDLRLGRWFLTLKATAEPVFEIGQKDGKGEERLATRHFVRFDDRFVLHPGRFVLGATLEWIKMPKRFVGSIVGKSSLGRRGLIIETAPVVHPGFAGCLTLELANVGEIPVALRPGMQIAQLVIDRAEGNGVTNSPLRGFRGPALGAIKTDDIAERIQRPSPQFTA